jgi:hypothetical protein
VAAEDLKVRSELAAAGELFNGYDPSMRAVDWTEDGRMAQRPIEDADEVDAGRAAIGLSHLATGQEEVLAAALREGQRSPPDLGARRAALEAWLAAVGWRTPGP